LNYSWEIFSVLGGVLGGIAGIVSLSILKLSGMSMEEVRYWQYQWKEDRNRSVEFSIELFSQNLKELVHIFVGYNVLSLVVVSTFLSSLVLLLLLLSV